MLSKAMTKMKVMMESRKGKDQMEVYLPPRSHVKKELTAS